MLAVNVISFPPPADAMKLVNQRVIDQAAEQRAGSVAESKDYTQYVYLGAAVFVFLLFIIILLLMMSIIKHKKQPEMPYYLPNRNVQYFPPIPEPQAPAQSVTPQGQSADASRQESRENKDMFYELRQLMVTTLVGNPKLASDIFRK